jgi:hypothetical protein
MNWFLDATERSGPVVDLHGGRRGPARHRLLAMPSRERLERVLGYLLDENEFLSPYGIRSLSRFHADHPFSFWIDGPRVPRRVRAGESDADVRRQLQLARADLVPVNYLHRRRPWSATTASTATT